MEFNLAEKLAIVKVIDEIIFADGKADTSEIIYLGELMQTLKFDFEFVQEARKVNNVQGLGILQSMGIRKKQILAQILQKMASADGEISVEEVEALVTIFNSVGIKIEDPEDQKQYDFDVSDIYFESSDHIRYEYGQYKSGPYGGARRAIRVEPHIEGKRGYSVTTYNLDNVHPAWGNNIQMAPKQMEIISSELNKTEMRGYDADPRTFGDPSGEFSNYGITIFHPNHEIEKIILHMHDREVDIEYVK